MHGVLSCRRLSMPNRSCLRGFTLAVALLGAWAGSASAQEYYPLANGPGPSIMLNLGGGIRSQDSAAEFRDAAKSWGLYQIAVMQAAAGRSQDAKRSLWQIDHEPPMCPSQVTGVWACWGQPVYGLRPMPLIMYGAGVPPCGPTPGQVVSCDARQGMAAVAGHVVNASAPALSGPPSVSGSAPSGARPAAVGLPANYLATDSRHGAIVDFTDERDSNGTRITARRYADGHVVIETLRGNAAATPPPPEPGNRSAS